MFIDKAALLGDCPHEKFDPDYLEEGSGPPVILVHSSMAGARQWSGLIPELSKRRNVRAVNLFGYGGTRAWSGSMRPSLDSFAELVASAVPTSAPTVSLVGHSLGGAVAMRAAAQHLGKRVDRLVLIEPSLFHLLDAYGRHEAYYEILALMEETARLLFKGASVGVRAFRRLLARTGELECELGGPAGRGRRVDQWVAGRMGRLVVRGWWRGRMAG